MKKTLFFRFPRLFGRVILVFSFCFFSITPASAADFTVTNTVDSGAGSLRDAIESANLAGEASAIVFNITHVKPVVLTSGLLEITGNITITGSGIEKLIIDGFGKSIFHVMPGAALNLQHLHLVNGKGTNGGAILNEGTLKLEAVHISDCAADNGGAIYNNGRLQVKASHFAGNTATGKGGAIYNANGGEITLDTGEALLTFSGNQASGVANSLFFSGTGVLTVQTGVAGILDMRDPLAGEPDANSPNQVNIRKSGTGWWLLGGDNQFTSTDKSDLNVNWEITEGWFSFYRNEEVPDPIGFGPDNLVTEGSVLLEGESSSFVFSGETVLNFGGDILYNYSPEINIISISGTDNQQVVYSADEQYTVLSDLKIRGTVLRGIGKGETVEIYRNGTSAGKADLISATAWEFQDDLSGEADGSYTYKAVVLRDGNSIGSSNDYTIKVVTTGGIYTDPMDGLVDMTYIKGNSKFDDPGKVTVENDGSLTLEGEAFQSSAGLFRDGTLDASAVQGPGALTINTTAGSGYAPYIIGSNHTENIVILGAEAKEFTGGDLNDIIMAPNEVIKGGVISGRGGTDALLADVVGVLPAVSLKPVLTDVEILKFRVQDDGSAGSPLTASVNAEDIAGATQFWSSESQGDLHVENVRIDSYTATVGMQSTEPDEVDYEFYFDSQYLKADVDNGTLTITGVALDNAGRVQWNDATPDRLPDDIINGGRANNLVIGSMDRGGIERFDVTVDRGSWLNSLSSTNNSLRMITVGAKDWGGDPSENGIGMNNPDGFAEGAQLFIGARPDDQTYSPAGMFNRQDASRLLWGGKDDAGIRDVKLFDASGYTGNINIYAEFTAEAYTKYLGDANGLNTVYDDNYAPDGEFKYGFGSGDDILNMYVRNSGIAADRDFALAIDMRDGNDYVNFGIDFTDSGTGFLDKNYAIDQTALKNVNIRTGAGSDIAWTWGQHDDNGTFALQLDQVNHAFDGAAGYVKVDGGTGNDAMYIAQNADVNNAVWVINGNTLDATTSDPLLVSYENGQARPLDDNVASIQNEYTINTGGAGSYALHGVVAFLGMEVDVKIGDYTSTGTSYTVGIEDINDAITTAIQEDPVLSKVLSVTDGAGYSLLVQSLINGKYTTNDFTVSFYHLDGLIRTGLILAADLIQQALFDSGSGNVDDAVGFDYHYYGLSEVSGGDGNDVLVAGYADAYVKAGAGNDIIIAGNETYNKIYGETGADIIVLGHREGNINNGNNIGSDAVNPDAHDKIFQGIGDSGTLFTITPTIGTTFVNTTTFDVIHHFDMFLDNTGIQSDRLHLTSYVGTAVISAAGAAVANLTDLSTTGNNMVKYIQGTYDVVNNSFTADGGTDMLIAYDSDSSTDVRWEAVVLTGVGIVTSLVVANDAANGDYITINAKPIEGIYAEGGGNTVFIKGNAKSDNSSKVTVEADRKVTLEGALIPSTVSLTTDGTLDASTVEGPGALTINTTAGSEFATTVIGSNNTDNIVTLGVNTQKYTSGTKNNTVNLGTGTYSLFIDNPGGNITLNLNSSTNLTFQNGSGFPNTINGNDGDTVTFTGLTRSTQIAGDWSISGKTLIIDSWAVTFSHGYLYQPADNQEPVSWVFDSNGITAHVNASGDLLVENTLHPAEPSSLVLDSDGFIDTWSGMQSNASKPTGSLGTGRTLDAYIVSGTGDLTLNTALVATAHSVTGSAAATVNNKVTLGTGASAYSGGSGNDAVTLMSGTYDFSLTDNAGNNTLTFDNNGTNLTLSAITNFSGDINGGDGNDSVTINGNVTGDINGGGGDDTVILHMDAILADGMTLSGGDGNDILSIIGEGSLDLSGLTVKNFEVLDLAAAGKQEVSLKASDLATGFSVQSKAGLGDGVVFTDLTAKKNSIDEMVNIGDWYFDESTGTLTFLYVEKRTITFNVDGIMLSVANGALWISNTAPKISGIPKHLQYILYNQEIELVDFTVTDDDGDNLTVTLTAANGEIGGVTDQDLVTDGIQLIGQADEINAHLANLTFTATGYGDVSIFISISDGKDTTTSIYFIISTGGSNTRPDWFSATQYYYDKLAAWNADGSNHTIEELKAALLPFAADPTAFDAEDNAAWNHYWQYGSAEGLPLRDSAGNLVLDPQTYCESELAYLKSVNYPGADTMTWQDVLDIITNADMSLHGHYMQYGMTEGLSLNSNFNTKRYFEAKLAYIQANISIFPEEVTAITTVGGLAQFYTLNGVDAYQNWLDFGEVEGITAAMVAPLP